MYVDVGLDATANSEITFHLMVNFSNQSFQKDSVAFIEHDDLSKENIINYSSYFQGTLQNRYWEIQVTQLSCSDPNLAPGGCLQYHTGHTGVIESFNWQNTDAKFHLANQVSSASFETYLFRYCFARCL
jgi:hypothetical protein